MPAPRIVEIPLVYEVSFLKKRARNAQTVVLKETIPIAIPAASDDEAPISFRVHPRTYGAQGTDPLPVRSTEESHWRPILRNYSGDDHPLSVETVISELMAGRRSISWPGLQDWSVKSAILPENLDPGRMISSQREWAIQQAEAAAAEMMICGDHVFVPCGEPVYKRIDLRSSDYFSATNTQAISKATSGDEVIPADRLDLIAEVLRRCGVPDAELVDPVASERVWHPIEILRPENVRYRHDEAPRLRKAGDDLVKQAREKIKNTIDITSPECLAAFHSLRTAVESKPSPRDLASAMAEFRGAIAGENWSSIIQDLDQQLSDWEKFVIEKSDDESLGQSL